HGAGTGRQRTGIEPLRMARSRATGRGRAARQPMSTVGKPVVSAPAQAVASPMRHAGRLLTNTVGEPDTRGNCDPGTTQRTWSFIRAWGSMPVNTFVEHGGMTGPVLGMAQTCKSVTRDAGIPMIRSEVRERT